MKIESLEDYDKAISLLVKLLKSDPLPGSEEATELVELSKTIYKFEQIAFPFRNAKPKGTE